MPLGKIEKGRMKIFETSIFHFEQRWTPKANTDYYCCYLLRWQLSALLMKEERAVVWHARSLRRKNFRRKAKTGPPNWLPWLPRAVRTPKENLLFFAIHFAGHSCPHSPRYVCDDVVDDDVENLEKMEEKKSWRATLFRRTLGVGVAAFFCSKLPEAIVLDGSSQRQPKPTEQEQEFALRRNL